MSNTVFSALLAAVEASGGIPKELVQKAFASGSPDASGLAYVAVTDRDKAVRVEPPFVWEEVHEALRGYYAECIRNDYRSAWADSRVSAVIDCCNWLHATTAEMCPAELAKWDEWIDWLVEVDRLSSERVRAAFDSSRPRRE